MKRVVTSLGMVLAVCLVIRVCWILVGSLLGPIAVFFMFAVIAWMLFAGPRFRG